MVSSLKIDLLNLCNQFTLSLKNVTESKVIEKSKKFYDQIGKLIFDDNTVQPNERILNELKKYETALNVTKNKSTQSLLNPQDNELLTTSIELQKEEKYLLKISQIVDRCMDIIQPINNQS